MPTSYFVSLQDENCFHNFTNMLSPINVLKSSFNCLTFLSVFFAIAYISVAIFLVRVTFSSTFLIGAKIGKQVN